MAEPSLSFVLEVELFGSTVGGLGDAVVSAVSGR